MRHVGYLMQLVAMSVPPALIIWQLTFGIRLIVMPATLLVAFIVFHLGHKLRED